MQQSTNRIGLRRGLIALAVSLAAVLAVSVVGGLVTADAVAVWYPTLRKPSYNPPDWVFGPVWTVLYVMMAVAAWRVWRRTGLVGGRVALGLYAGQLALNLGWSLLFFGARQVGLALAEIVLLFIAILATAIVFSRIDRLAAALLLPYLLWVAFAALLNAAIWSLN
ncbi:MAG: TspO/MBR family protein [Alphaproteobacteria bacterium]